MNCHVRISVFHLLCPAEKKQATPKSARILLRVFEVRSSLAGEPPLIAVALQEG
jgi:hypothetical protein